MRPARTDDPRRPPGLNPAGVRVTASRCPAVPKPQHDYLWRVHAACPAKGQIGVFNRSHYEDVLVVRVKKLVPESPSGSGGTATSASSSRCLTDEGTTIVKMLPERVERGAARAPAGAGRRPREAVEVPPRRPRRPRAVGRVHEGVPGRVRGDDAPTRRRGTSCPADRNWARNLAVAKILRVARWRGSTRSCRRPSRASRASRSRDDRPPGAAL